MITIVTKTRKEKINHFGGKKMKKKLLSVMLVGALAISALTGCGSKETASDDSQKTGTTTEADSSSDAADTSDFDNSEMINVQSREDGSGTRGAFIELFGIEEKDADGNKIDNTTEEANITNSTEVMLTSVAGDEYAIGYVSLGSLNDTVKALRLTEQKQQQKISKPVHTKSQDHLTSQRKVMQQDLQQISSTTS